MWVKVNGPHHQLVCPAMHFDHWHAQINNALEF